MKKNNMIKQLKYVNKLIDLFKIYTSCLDDYYENEENRKNNKELYGYYKNLKDNIVNTAKKYEVIN